VAINFMLLTLQYLHILHISVPTFVYSDGAADGVRTCMEVGKFFWFSQVTVNMWMSLSALCNLTFY
jgi:hypothetical protein